MLIRVGIVLLIAFVGLVSLKKAKDTYPHGWAVHPDVLQIMQRLERELDSSRSMLQYPVIHPPGRYLEIFFGNEYIDYWMARYHSHRPEKVLGIFSPEHLQDRVNNTPAGTHILIRKPRPEIEIPDRMKLLEVMDPYELWEVI